MKKIASIVIVAVLSVLLVGGAFLFGFATSHLIFAPPAAVASASSAAAPDGTPPEFQEDIPLFFEAWKIINDNFYTQPIDQNKMTYAAIGGMVDALGDIHTAFVDPKTAKYLQEQLQGSFEGIGATVDMVNGRLTIVAPIKGSPAEAAGLEAGDVILKVDNTVIQNMDVNEAIAVIRGPKGTKVHLTYQRGSAAASEIDVTRDTINVPSIESKMLEDNSVAYVDLTDFGEKTPQELRSALQDVMSKNPKALIFDLRSNPGGYLSTAVDVVSEFLPANQGVLIEKDRAGHQQVYNTTGDGLATDVPMVLLVNEYSASASEITSAALKDHHRATIIGVTTYGKGSVQTVHQLSDTSQLRVTIANFFSPNDNVINHVGITPDVVVPDPTEYEHAHGIDPQLQKAIDLIKSGGLTKPDGTSMNIPTPSGATSGLLQDLFNWVSFNWLSPIVGV